MQVQGRGRAPIPAYLGFSDEIDIIAVTDDMMRICLYSTAAQNADGIHECQTVLSEKYMCADKIKPDTSGVKNSRKVQVDEGY